MITGQLQGGHKTRKIFWEGRLFQQNHLPAEGWLLAWMKYEYMIGLGFEQQDADFINQTHGFVYELGRPLPSIKNTTCRSLR